MVPICAVLAQWKPVGEGFTWGDPRKADTRDAVHVWRNKQPVPMDGRCFVQLVVHANRRGLAFSETQYGARQQPVHHRGHGTAPGDIAATPGDDKIGDRAGAVKRGGRARRGSPCMGWGQCVQRRPRTRSGAGLQKAAARIQVISLQLLAQRRHSSTHSRMSPTCSQLFAHASQASAQIRQTRPCMGESLSMKLAEV